MEMSLMGKVRFQGIVFIENLIIFFDLPEYIKVSDFWEF